MRILYLEDDLTNLAFFERVLSLYDDELVGVQSPDDAWSELENNHFDVIFADIELGAEVMDGVSFIAYLRDQGIETPTVIITAYDFEEYYRRGVEAGSNYHILKPVSANDLLMLLDQFR
jgi:CheY-like chemotaxis protein